MTPTPTTTGLAEWLDRAGDWHGVNHVWASMDGSSDESPSTVAVVAVVGGTFVRLDQRWAFQGRPQEGSLLVGHDPQTGAATVCWADTFHTGHRVMAFVGTLDADGAIDVTGTYSAGSGPDWGWRIRLAGAGPEHLRVTMHNVHPDGQADLAVDAEYARHR